MTPTVTPQSGPEVTMTITYDVTAVNWNDERVPLTAGTSYSMAHEIAQPRSGDDDWYEIEIRETATGQIVAKYAGGAIISGSR